MPFICEYSAELIISDNVFSATNVFSFTVQLYIQSIMLNQQSYIFPTKLELAPTILLIQH